MNDAIAELVRRHDPDRFLTALFAPPDRRDALLTLYAFNHELARAPEVASETMLALIRLQWWREVVEGTSRRHEVATPLSEAIAQGRLRREDLLPLIEAREAEAEGPLPATADWWDWLDQGAGGLAVAAAGALGAPEPERFRPFGAAYGLAGVLHNVVPLARAQRCLLPADALAAHGLSAEAVTADPAAPPLQALLAEFAAQGRERLRAVRRAAQLPRHAIAAALPGVLAARDLARWPRPAHPRGLADRLAVTWAGLRGRP